MATDATTREQLNALAQFAELERQNSNMLHVQAFAEKGKQFPIMVIPPNNVRTSTIFTIRLCFSLPGTIQTLRVLKTQEKSPNPNTQEVKVFERKDMRQSLSFDVNFIEETLQPAENYGLILEMKLQTFVKWTLQMPQALLNSNICHKGAKIVRNGEEFLVLRWDFMNTLYLKNWALGIHHKTLPYLYRPLPVQRDANDPSGQFGNMDTRFDFYNLPPPSLNPGNLPLPSQHPGSSTGMASPALAQHSGNFVGMAPTASAQHLASSDGNPQIETNKQGDSVGAGQ